MKKKKKFDHFFAAVQIEVAAYFYTFKSLCVCVISKQMKILKLSNFYITNIFTKIELKIELNRT